MEQKAIHPMRLLSLSRVLFLLLCAGVAHAAPFTIGQGAVFTSADSENGNLLLEQQAQLSQQGTLKSLSFYVTAASGQLYLGVYDNAGKLVASTAVFTPVAGWNTRPVLTPVLLAPGSYWLAYHPSSNALGFVKSNTGQGARWYTRTFAALPASFGTSYSTTPSQWSFYATLDSVPPRPVDAAPGAPSILLSKWGQMRFAWDAVQGAAGYRLYVGPGKSGCPGSQYTSVSATTAGTVTHLAWSTQHYAQATAVDSYGRESPCSNQVVGQPN